MAAHIHAYKATADVVLCGHFTITAPTRLPRHRGGCTVRPDRGFIDREEAIIALAEPDIEVCQVCNHQAGLT
ncbi:DUF6233 domain-containing protein [Streptomyces sp. NPDC005134]